MTARAVATRTRGHEDTRTRVSRQAPASEAWLHSNTIQNRRAHEEKSGKTGGNHKLVQTTNTLSRECVLRAKSAEPVRPCCLEGQHAKWRLPRAATTPHPRPQEVTPLRSVTARGDEGATPVIWI